MMRSFLADAKSNFEPDSTADSKTASIASVAASIVSEAATIAPTSTSTSTVAIVAIAVVVGNRLWISYRGG